MKKIIFLLSCVVIAFSFLSPIESSASSGTCYVKAFSHGEEVCFVCVTSETSQVCTTGECGDEFCWTAPGEN